MRSLREELSTMAERVRQVVRQTRARVVHGLTQLPGKIVSVFEPHSEIIRKGKASQPTEFGKLVQITEAENQIVTHCDVFEERPSDRQLLAQAVARQRERLGRAPQMVTADAGYYAQAHEQAVLQMASSGWRFRIATRTAHNASSEKKAAGSEKRKPGARAGKHVSAY